MSLHFDAVYVTRALRPKQLPVLRARLIACVVLSVAIVLNSGHAFGQITINEVVEDDPSNPDTREFVELYNAGSSELDISGWTIGAVQLSNGSSFATYPLPGGSIIPGHGYFVMGQASVANANCTPAAGELFPNANFVFELRNPTQAGPTTLVDALGLETFRGLQLANATQEQLNQIAAGQTAGETATGGWWGQVSSNNGVSPNVSLSLGRYLDGRDTNRNGLDFGLQPVTPGASNNLPQVTAHTVPNVDNLDVGSKLGSNYAASAVLPRVIDPTVAGSFNPNAIAESPQGGKAIVSYDESGGGNAVVSKELVTKFDIYAYIDPRALNVTIADNAPQSEATIYGIGTTDPFFTTPNSAGLLTGNPGGNLASSTNGSTGLGWLIQRRELYNGSTANRTTKTVLQLIDMNDGGDGVTSRGDWQPKLTLDLTGTAEGWHRLSIEYDPATGSVTARYDNNLYNFMTANGLVGNFYVGWRENLPGANNAAGRPPTYDLFAGGMPGDFDGDGKVDAADYVTWVKNSGNGALPNDNGLTTQAARYELWRLSFGTAGGSGALFSVAVPEPSVVGLVSVGFMSLLARWGLRAVRRVS